MVDARLNDVNLAVVDWSQMNMLGDEHEARQGKQLVDYERAVRANRQLAVVLRNQGLNEVADRFAYRAQRLQRRVFRLQAFQGGPLSLLFGWPLGLPQRVRNLGSYVFSLFLDLLAGYGYRPGRSVFWYLVMILGFAMTYYGFGHLPLFPDAFVFSLTSFHGRGFFPGLGNETSLHNPLVVLAAIEAVIGLFIEISFIATFTQRYFGR